jgi:hypothetical protein
MSNGRTVWVAQHSVAKKSKRVAPRRSQRDSQALVVASLTVLATGIALYDLVLLAVGMQ